MTEKPRILVIDDDEPLLQLMRSILTEYKFEPVLASTGERALELARNNTPQLMLLDKNMPGMSGEEVIRAFRADSQFNGIPILILSGEPLSPRELAALGADGTVQKPFDLGKLVREIRGCLSDNAKSKGGGAALRSD